MSFILVSAMRLPRFGIVALVTFLIVVSLNVDMGFLSGLLGVVQAVDEGFIRQSQVLAQKPDERKAEADRLLQQGIEQFDTSQFEAALQSWQQTLTIYREIINRRGEGVTLNNIGAVYCNLRQYSQALERYQQALAIHKEVGNRAGEGTTLYNLGLLYNNYEFPGDRGEVLPYFQEALAIAKELNDSRMEIIILMAIGDVYRFYLNDYSRGFEVYQKVLELQTVQGESSPTAVNSRLEAGVLDSPVEAKVVQYENLEELPSYKNAARLNRRGMPVDALANFLELLLIVKDVNDRAGEGTILWNIGIVFYDMERYSQALESYRQALAIFKEIGDRVGESKVLNTIGLAHEALGQYSQALEVYKRSLTIDRELGDRSGEGIILNNQGKVYERLGEYKQAFENYEQALAIHREVQNKWMESVTLKNMAEISVYLNQYSQALKIYDQVVLLNNGGLNFLLETRYKRGLVYSYLGEYEIALGEYEYVLAVLMKDDVTPYNPDRRLAGYVFNSIGLAYEKLGQYSEALEVYKEALKIFREIGDKAGEGLTLKNLGNFYNNQGLDIEAEKSLFKAIEAWESLRASDLADRYQISLFETQYLTYQLLQQVLINQNKTDAALEVAERGRARALVELLQQRLLATDSVADITDSLSVNSARSTSAASVIPSIATIQQISKQQNATLVEYSIIYDTFKVEGKEEAKESELYIWVIKPTGEITFRQADLKPLWQQQDISLTDLVYISRNSIGVRGRGGGIAVSLDDSNPTQRLRQLHQLLIEPIADLLPPDPNAPVIFLPQSSLFLVPFPALQDALGQYLIEQYTILTAPAIQVLDLTHEMGTRNKDQETENTLIVGNPTMPKVVLKVGEPPQQLSSLPGAEKEAQEIAQLLNTNALIGNQATKTAVVEQMKNARIIHLATHGLLDDFKGLGIPGAIVLAPNPTSSLTKREEIRGNGLLTADEIFDLKLNAELVVLSACDTGRGRVTGDGVIGLSRSLISAGVPSVVVSLWSVSDDSTAFLMTEFYKNLQQNIDKAQALRLAMLATKERYPNPLHWAAFTLIGESE